MLQLSCEHGLDAVGMWVFGWLGGISMLNSLSSMFYGCIVGGDCICYCADVPKSDSQVYVGVWYFEEQCQAACAIFYKFGVCLD